MNFANPPGRNIGAVCPDLARSSLPQRYMRKPTLLPAVALVLLAFSWGAREHADFDLGDPDRTYQLPDELAEISALTDVDANTIACLHDEEARLYFMDLESGSIDRTLEFGVPGDMEGLTRVREEYFALRSDGLVYRMKLLETALLVTDTFRLSIPNRNIEGLGWDEKNGVVLISPKDTPKGKPEVRDTRRIFCYDPIAKRMCDEPALTLSIERIVAQARAMNVEVPMKQTGNGREVPAMKLRFSSVAVDPVTDTYYLLSASDRILLVVDRKGDLVRLEQLDVSLFKKPEGITFLPGGDMLISNEGKDAPPNIHRFNRKRS